MGLNAQTKFGEFIFIGCLKYLLSMSDHEICEDLKFNLSRVGCLNLGLGKIRQLGQLTRIIRHVQTWTLSFWYNIT